MIRHEYAHYMDDKIYGKMGHGVTWKKCCTEIGALPIRLYPADREEHLRKKQKEEQEIREQCSEYRVGDQICHPRFGTGRIEKITGKTSACYAEVLFPEAGMKKLSLVWVDANCELRRE